MSLFKPFVEKRALAYQDVWGSGGDWQSYKDQAVLAHGAVYACAKLISSKVAGCPIEVYRASPDGVATKIQTPSVFLKPCRQETPQQWKYRAVSSLVLRGETFGLPIGALGSPSQVFWLDNSLVTVEDSLYPDVEPYYYYRAKTMSPVEFIHMTAFVQPGSVRGLSPIGQFRKTFEAGLLAQKYGSDWFESGGQPSGVLETEQPIDDTEAEILAGRWKTRRTNGGIAVLGSGAKYQGVQVTPEESQFIATQQFSVTQVARIFGVPPEMIGGDAGNSLTYSNREQRAIDFASFTLEPYITALEEHFTRLLPRGQFVMLNTEKLLAGDLKSRLEARAIGIASHQMTPTEARAEEGKGPLTTEQKTELAAVPITVTPAGKLKTVTAPSTDKPAGAAA